MTHTLLTRLLRSTPEHRNDQKRPTIKRNGWQSKQARKSPNLVKKWLPVSLQASTGYYLLRYTRTYCDETRHDAFMNDWRLTAAGPSMNRVHQTARQVLCLKKCQPVTPPVQVTATGTDEEPHHQQPIQLAMVKTTPPIHRVVCHQASTAASGCWQASIVGNPLKRECLQYIKRPGGYVQLRNDAIDQERQKKSTIRAVPINCAEHHSPTEIKDTRPADHYWRETNLVP
jgi:hypothetical protein